MENMPSPAPNPTPEEILRPAQEGEFWAVLHSKPRCEKKILSLQQQRPARMYLPCLERVHNYAGRIRRTMNPMFPGYVFACLRQEDLSWFHSNQYVANLLPVAQPDRLLYTLRAVEEALQAELSLEILPFLQEGREVIITGGPLKGTRALIARVDSKHKVVLHLELIQKSVALEIESSFLKAADI